MYLGMITLLCLIGCFIVYNIIEMKTVYIADIKMSFDATKHIANNIIVLERGCFNILSKCSTISLIIYLDPIFVNNIEDINNICESIMFLFSHYIYNNMDSFAFIEEVWSEEESCLPKSQDDIMSSFVNNDNTSCYPPTGLLNTFRPKHPIMDEVSGYDYGSDNLNFSNYFDQDLQIMKNNDKVPDVDYCESEDNGKKTIGSDLHVDSNDSAYVDKDTDSDKLSKMRKLYEDVVESYENNKNKPVLSNEMIIYILSGILLLFIIDKLITIGMMLKRN